MEGAQGIGVEATVIALLGAERNVDIYA
jgi:hypothetical protein